MTALVRARGVDRRSKSEDTGTADRASGTPREGICQCHPPLDEEEAARGVLALPAAPCCWTRSPNRPGSVITALVRQKRECEVLGMSRKPLTSHAKRFRMPRK